MHFLLSTLSHIAIALTVHYLSIFFNLFLFNWLLLFNLFLFNWLLFLFNWLLFFNRLLFYYRLLLLGWIFLSWFISLFSAFSDLAFGLLAYELSLIIFLLTRWLRRKHIFFFLLGMLCLLLFWLFCLLLLWLFYLRRLIHFFIILFNLLLNIF